MHQSFSKPNTQNKLIQFSRTLINFPNLISNTDIIISVVLVDIFLSN